MNQEEEIEMDRDEDMGDNIKCPDCNQWVVPVNECGHLWNHEVDSLQYCPECGCILDCNEEEEVA